MVTKSTFKINVWRTSGCYLPGMGQTGSIAFIRLVSFIAAALMRREREMLAQVVAVPLSTAAAAAIGVAKKLGAQFSGLSGRLRLQMTFKHRNGKNIALICLTKATSL